jgi:hypothetical protein
VIDEAGIARIQIICFTSESAANHPSRVPT